jgi:hypothetical protein
MGIGGDRHLLVGMLVKSRIAGRYSRRRRSMFAGAGPEEQERTRKQRNGKQCRQN